MQASEQQQQEQIVSQKQATQNAVDTQSVILCPNCGAELPEEALFCSECSYAVKQHICPKCGTANSFSSDICNSCKTWLLEKQCKFCYAELSDDASFCPECGKPKEGIPCPHCGNLSIFDFCTKCGKPITEEAVAEAQAVQENTPLDTHTAAIEAEIAKLEAIANSEPATEDGDVFDPDDHYEPVVETEPVRKSLFSDGQLSSILKTGADIDEAQEKRAEEARIAEEKRKEAWRLAKIAKVERQQQIEAQAKIEALRKELEQYTDAQKAAIIEDAKQSKNKKFPSSQQARRWHNAHRHPGAIAWKCNAYGTVHYYSDGGPNECGDPAKGGYDIFE
jgi:predicted amidophosphoribosyltransferase